MKDSLEFLALFLKLFCRTKNMSKLKFKGKKKSHNVMPKWSGVTD